MHLPSPQALGRLAGRLRIAHHIPGRVRLKLTGTDPAGVANAAGEIQAFCNSADRIDGIRSVKLNLLARSCTVEYEPAVISPTTWEDLVAGKDSPAVASLLNSVVAS